MSPRTVWLRYGDLEISNIVGVTWVLMLAIIAPAMVAVRDLRRPKPGGLALLAEAFVESMDELFASIIGPGHRPYLPLLATTMLFVTVANLAGVLPGITPPTSDLSTVTALGGVIFIITQWASIEQRGLKRFLLDYFEPFWWLFPINLVGVVSRPVSHIFRLYGNMVGGAILISVVTMFAPFIVPVPLVAWFSVFVGVVQAFVFTLLATVYIAESRRGS